MRLVQFSLKIGGGELRTASICLDVTGSYIKRGYILGLNCLVDFLMESENFNGSLNGGAIFFEVDKLAKNNKYI